MQGDKGRGMQGAGRNGVGLEEREDRISLWEVRVAVLLLFVSLFVSTEESCDRR